MPFLPCTFNFCTYFIQIWSLYNLLGTAREKYNLLRVYKFLKVSGRFFVTDDGINPETMNRLTIDNMQYTRYPVPTNAISSLLARLVDYKIVSYVKHVTPNIYQKLLKVRPDLQLRTE